MKHEPINIVDTGYSMLINLTMFDTSVLEIPTSGHSSFLRMTDVEDC